jgi:hypothetical protein
MLMAARVKDTTGVFFSKGPLNAAAAEPITNR